MPWSLTLTQVLLGLLFRQNLERLKFKDLLFCGINVLLIDSFKPSAESRVNKVPQKIGIECWTVILKSLLVTSIVTYFVT